MSNKRAPTEPSYFVPSILRPVKSFFAIGTGDGPGASLKAEYLQPFASDIFQSVSQRFVHCRISFGFVLMRKHYRYAFYLTAMKKTEESLRRLKKGRQSAFSLFGNTTAGNDEDEERIRNQMILDVDAFGRDAESLGVSPHASEAFKSLKEMVHTTLMDDQ
jgi:hypothetical protein